MPPPPSAIDQRLRRTWPGGSCASHGGWARFTFNGNTSCETGSFALVGDEELSDAATWP